MTSRTVGLRRFLDLQRLADHGTPGDIHLVSHRLKMVRVDARAVAAEMIKLEADGHGSDEEPVTRTMRLNGTPIEVKPAIARLPVHVAEPLPTRRLNNDRADEVNLLKQAVDCRSCRHGRGVGRCATQIITITNFSQYQLSSSLNSLDCRPPKNPTLPTSLAMTHSSLFGMKGR
jgi:hypothetical protein